MHTNHEGLFELVQEYGMFSCIQSLVMICDVFVDVLSA